jgi:hypothetical protein
MPMPQDSPAEGFERPENVAVNQIVKIRESIGLMKN